MSNKDISSSQKYPRKQGSWSLNTLWKSVLSYYCTQKFISNGMCIRFLQQYQLYHLTESVDARHHHHLFFILQQLQYEVNVDLLPWLGMGSGAYSPATFLVSDLKC